jgi:poly(A) polymerase
VSLTLGLTRAALAEHPAWLVGGLVRDRVLGRETTDLDVVLDGDPEQAARALTRAARRAGVDAACFPLSEKFGAWRVVGRDDEWQVDMEALRGGSIETDLGLRDFTVNAIAEPLEGGASIDPLGGLLDLRERRLRMAGPAAFEDDPLRVLRLVRLVVELDLEPERATLQSAAVQSARLVEVSGERVFSELQRILATERAVHGMELMARVGATAAVLPELEATRGVQQSHYHHLDVYGHTLEVLQCAIDLQADLSVLGEESGVEGSSAGAPSALAEDAGEGGAVAGEVSVLLEEPLADGLTRGQALRWGALLHDAAKPATRALRPSDGRVTFIGHDRQGAQLARDVLARLRASVRLREHVAALVRHHLRLGFLVHEPQPPAREAVYDYLRATNPVEVDVTLLSVADRLATRGERSSESIRAHLQLARRMLPHALHWRAEGPPAPLIRGDELAAALQIEAGPRLGELLEQLTRAQFCGRVRTREQAIELARDRLI